MQVRDVMSREVVTVDVETSVRECAARMLAENVGSVVVTKDGTPTGIVTESDVLKAGVARDEPLSAFRAGAVMSHPLERIAPTATVRKAAATMQRNDIKKLAVTDGLTLVGVVTYTDLVRNLPRLEREAANSVRSHDRWKNWEAYR